MKFRCFIRNILDKIAMNTRHDHVLVGIKVVKLLPVMRVDQRLAHRLNLRVVYGLGNRIISFLLGQEFDVLIKLIFDLHQLYQIIFLKNFLRCFMYEVVGCLFRLFNVRKSHDLSHVDFVLDKFEK